MKRKFLDYFVKVAELTAELSSATRLKVGSVIVKDNRIISCGYNGTASGSSNECEYPIVISADEYHNLSADEKIRYTDYEDGLYHGLKTYDHVIHSEANSISRLAMSTESGFGASLIVTHSPCLQCSKIIYGAGIKAVYYKNSYRSDDGINFLRRCGITVIKLD